MIEYLVESHLGGLYTSTQDVEWITQTCEQCWDSDQIITSWDDEEEKSMINALKELVKGKYYNSHERMLNDIQQTIDYIDELIVEECVKQLFEETDFKKEDNINFIHNLIDDDIINKIEHRTLMLCNTKTYNKEIELIKTLDTSNIKKSESTRIRRLKK